MMKFDVTLTFVEPLLGTVPKSKEVYADYIAGKAALTDEQLAEELASVENLEERGWTGFHTVDGRPIIYDYLVKGFFKDAASMLRRVPGTKSAKMTAYKKIIDGLVFIAPRQLQLELPDGQPLVVIERPLRAQTAQGERVSLARSDAAPAGTILKFTVSCIGDSVNETVLREWLDYGALRGMGQWRNSGMGRFDYVLSAS